MEESEFGFGGACFNHNKKYTSLLHCVDDNGDLVVVKVAQYFKQKRQKRLDELDATIDELITKSNEDDNGDIVEDNNRNNNKNGNSNQIV